MTTPKTEEEPGDQLPLDFLLLARGARRAVKVPLLAFELVLVLLLLRERLLVPRAAICFSWKQASSNIKSDWSLELDLLRSSIAI